MNVEVAVAEILERYAATGIAVDGDDQIVLAASITKLAVGTVPLQARDPHAGIGNHRAQHSVGKHATTGKRITDNALAIGIAKRIGAVIRRTRRVVLIDVETFTALERIIVRPPLQIIRAGTAVEAIPEEIVAAN